MINRISIEKIKLIKPRNFDSNVSSQSKVIDSIALKFEISTVFDGRASNMTVNIKAKDNLSSIAYMKISPSSSFESAKREAFSASKVMPYVKNIKVQLKNSLNNTTEINDHEVTYTATLSQARGYLSATNVGSKVFFAGGENGESILRCVMDCSFIDRN